MQHAADEPTAMWGAEDLAQLGLDRPPSEPPKGPAQPAKPGRRDPSVRVTLDRNAPTPTAATPKRSQSVQWTLTIVGALLLAAVAFFVVRALR